MFYMSTGVKSYHPPYASLLRRQKRATQPQSPREGTARIWLVPWPATPPKAHLKDSHGDVWGRSCPTSWGCRVLKPVLPRLSRGCDLPADSDAAGLGGPRFCTSNKLPGNATAGLQAILWGASSYRMCLPTSCSAQDSNTRASQEIQGLRKQKVNNGWRGGEVLTKILVLYWSLISQTHRSQVSGLYTSM